MYALLGNGVNLGVSNIVSSKMTKVGGADDNLEEVFSAALTSSFIFLNESTTQPRIEKYITI